MTMIVDSQVHVWPRTDFHGDVPEAAGGRDSFTADDLLAEMRLAGVDRAVLIPPRWVGERNDFALAAAQKHPEKFAVMGRMSVEKAESRSLLPAWKSQPGMLGVRVNFKISPREWLRDGTADWFWRDAEAYQIPVMVHAPGLADDMQRIAERHPGLRLIIDHMALSGSVRGPKAFAGIDELIGLARNPNIAVKASALPCYADDPYPYRRLHPFIRRTFDAFGPQRMFWGSDASRLPSSYRECVTMFTEEMDWLSGDDLEWVMGRALCEWLNWPLEPSLASASKPAEVHGSA